jgi:hypothetical protein
MEYGGFWTVAAITAPIVALAHFVLLGLTGAALSSIRRWTATTDRRSTRPAQHLAWLSRITTRLLWWGTLPQLVVLGIALFALAGTDGLDKHWLRVLSALMIALGLLLAAVNAYSLTTLTAVSEAQARAADVRQ